MINLYMPVFILNVGFSFGFYFCFPGEIFRLSALPDLAEIKIKRALMALGPSPETWVFV
jgi:hypothetical protein